MTGQNSHLAALDAAFDVFYIRVGVSRLLRNSVLGAFSGFIKGRRLSILEALLAACNSSGLDGVDNSRALRRDFDISLLSDKEDSQG